MRSSTPSRARTGPEKSERRLQILSAALASFEPAGELASVAEIASKAGLAKGTVYLYFRTREEIFLALLEEQIHAWLNRFEQGLRAEDPAPTDGLVDKALENPAFLPLASLASGVLERNLEAPTALGFRRAWSARIGDLATRIESIFGFPPGTGVPLMVRSYAMLIGLWQFHEPAPAIRALLAPEELAGAQDDFATDARQALRHLWAGAKP